MASSTPNVLLTELILNMFDPSGRSHPYAKRKCFRIRDTLEKISHERPTKKECGKNGCGPDAALMTCKMSQLTNRELCFVFAAYLQAVSRTVPLDIPTQPPGDLFGVPKDFSAITSVQWNSIGSIAFCSSRDGFLRKYVDTVCYPTDTNLFSPVPLTAFDLLFDGRVVITVGFDSIISIYDYECPESFKRIMAHDDVITCIHRSDDLVATGSHDCLVKVWKLVTDTSVNAPLGNSTLPPRHLDCMLYLKNSFEHEGGVTALCIDKKKNRLVVADEIKIIYIWTVDKSSMIAKIIVAVGNIHTLKLNSQYDRVLICGDERRVATFDLKDGGNFLYYDLPFKFECVEWNGKLLLGGTDKGELIVCNSSQKHVRAIYKEHKCALTAMCVGPDGSLLTGDASGCQVVWRANIIIQGLASTHDITHRLQAN